MFFSRIRSCCFSRVVRDGLFGKFEVEFDGQINTFPVCIEVLWTPGIFMCSVTTAGLR